MSTQNKLHQLRLQEWTSRFADQKSSGLTTKQWCDQNNISIHAYNYWRHQLKEEVIDQVLPDIAPLSLSPIDSNHQPIQQLTPPVSDNSIRSNCAIPANCTNRANSDSIVKLYVNGICIELEPSIPEPFLFALIKAARYA